MNTSLNDILERISQLEEELQSELKRRRDALEADFDNRRVHFEQALVEQHRRFKTGLFSYITQADLRNAISAPIIYSLIVPMLMLDVALTVYQWLCFPLYRIERVHRKDCWTYDRAHLAYLNALEKLNCAYCTYGNGLAAYFSEIASRTEQYWCPIKHAKRIRHAHSRYNHFVDYGDAEGFKAELQHLREQLQRMPSHGASPTTPPKD
jgi:hypothetical protein